MPRTVYEHLVRLTGDNAGLVRAADGSSAAIKRLDESSRRGQSSLDKYNNSLQVSTRATTAFARAFGGITVGLIAREFVQAADSMTLLEGRLRIVTDSAIELNAVQKQLFDSAQDSRASIEATTSFYVRLAQRLGDTTSGTLGLIEVSNLVSKSLKIGGATAKETSSSLLQLSQALSSGLLRGDEFRSLSENAVGFMQAISEGAGVSQAELRKLSIEGKLTTELILDALEKSAPKINEQFNQIPVTFGDALQRLQNIAVTGIDNLNKDFNITGKLVKSVEVFAENIDLVVLALGNLIALKVRASILGQVEAFAASAAAARAAATETTNKVIADRRAAAEAFRVVAAEQSKKAALVATLTTERQSIASEIAREKALIKTNAAVFGLSTSTARLNTLQGAGLVASRNLTAAKEQLGLATLKASAAQTALGNQFDFNGKKVSGFSRAVSFLGGPLGIGLLVAQLGLLAFSFFDFGKAVELSADSTRLLNLQIQSLEGLSFDELEAKKQQTRGELDWQIALASGTEASEQRIALLSKQVEEIDKVANATEQGKDRILEETKALENSRAVLVESIKTRSVFNDVAFGGSSQAAALAAAQRDLSEATKERTRLEREALEVHDAALLAFGFAQAAGTKEEQVTRKLIEALKDEASAREGKRKSLERLLDIQKDSSVFDKLSADEQVVLADKIKKLNEQINGKTKKSKEQLPVTEKLIQQENKLTKQIAELGAAHDASGQDISIFSTRAEQAQKQLDKLRGVVDTSKQAVKDLTKQYKDGKIDVEEFERELRTLGLTQEEINRITGNTISVLDRYRDKLFDTNQELKDHVTEQKILLSDGPQAARLYAELARAAREYGGDIESLPPEIRKIIEENIALGQTKDDLEELNNAFASFADSLADAIVDGEDLGDFFKNLWKQMVKDFLASGITKLIGSLFSGGGFDLSGFTTGGSGGSTLGGLLGGLLGGGNSPSGSTPSGTTPSGSIPNAIGNALGLDNAQTQNVIAGAGALLTLYNGYNQLANGNEVSGAIQVAGGGVNAFNAYQDLVGGQALSGNVAGGIGLAGNLLGIYNGIQQGGIEGYGSAAFNGFQTYQALQGLGLLGGGAQGASAFSQLSTFSNSFGTAADALALNNAGVVGQGGGTLSGGGSTLGTAGNIAGGVLGAYNIYGGLSEGGTRGTVQAAGGAVSLASSLGYLSVLGPYGAAIGAVISLLAGTGGARDYDQILQEDYLPDLLGSQGPGEALGLNGAIGFNGGNTGIFGANFGIQGSGITSQFLADGGENGNGGFFTGSQAALDGFEKALRAAGFDELIDNEAGTLRVFDSDKNVEDIREVWAAYAEGLDESVAASEVFKTAVENGLIQPSNLFFEQFALGFGESAFEAKDSLLLIDEAFDAFVSQGVSGTDALFQSISEHYGIAVQDAQFFVEQSGVAADQWVQNFTSASGEALAEILDFNAEGITAFEALGQAGAEQAALVQDSFINDLSELEGLLNNIDLGNARGRYAIEGITGETAPHIGDFASALNSSQTVGFNGSSIDSLRTIRVNGNEEGTFSRKGSMERIQNTLDTLIDVQTTQGAPSSDELLYKVQELIDILAASAAKQQPFFGK